MASRLVRSMRKDSKKRKVKDAIKKLWQKALRSGEYKKTRFNLCRNGRYCALGVLCDLYAKEHSLDDFEFHEYSIPLDVREWAGIDSCFECKIIDMNDGIGSSGIAPLRFREIARKLDDM